MHMTAEELISRLAIPALPERWLTFYDEVMDDFDRNGCEWADPARYDRLHEEYGALPRYLDAYRNAAAQVAQNEPLARLLALMCHALTDREQISADIKQFVQPQPAEGEDSLAYDMLTGLAICSALPYVDRMLRSRGYPDEVVFTALRQFENGTSEYARRHDGRPGYSLWAWYQRHIDGKIFRIGRLKVEFYAKFKDTAYVLENRAGDRMILANGVTLHESGFALGAVGYEDESGAWEATVTETDEAWIGHPYRENGRVAGDAVTLPKEEWRVILAPGDDVISLHIPPDGSLSPESVDETIALTREFVARYLPDLNPRAFVCGSWMLDPQLEELMGEDSNIVKFGKRFMRMTQKSSGRDVFYFIFLKPHSAEFEIDELPEHTRLERALKAHYLSGKVIYVTYGCFF